jgi:hypothetical protein
MDRFVAESPESKLELIDGRLIAGNGLTGSRYMLADVLATCGPSAALPLAPVDLWMEALRQGFAALDPPAPRKPLAAWQAWASQVSYEPAVAPAGPCSYWPHYGAANRLRMGLFEVAREGGFGISLGRDVAMRLGDNGFTPDVLLIGPERMKSLYDSYLDGPADLVIEVCMPGHEEQDREVKRGYYEAGGVPEYWVVDPTVRTVELLRRTADGYRPQAVAADGRYRPASGPGLALVLDWLWDRPEDYFRSPPVFAVETPGNADGRLDCKEGPGWGHLPFRPEPALEPRRVRFEEFISWCPRAKFERVEGRPLIGGRLGTRNVLGMLLRTFGLAEAVTLLPPVQWILAMRQDEESRTVDADRKAEWWAVVRRVAALLREKHGAGRLTVIGDLTRPAPLNAWSDVTLVGWDLPDIPWEFHREVSKLAPGIDLDVIEYERATPAQLQEIEETGVEI